MLLWRPERLLPVCRFASLHLLPDVAYKAYDKQSVGEWDVLDTSKKVIVLVVHAYRPYTMSQSQ